VVYRELRVSSVKSGAMQAWLSEWREHIKPLRVRLGFAIPAAWVVECEDRFVWLLEYDGDDFEAANAAYYDSSERQALDPDPARHLSATEHLPLQSVFSTRDANTRAPQPGRILPTVRSRRPSASRYAAFNRRGPYVTIYRRCYRTERIPGDLGASDVAQRAECASAEVAPSISHPGGRRFESG
jgi:hypothetical protein